MIIVRFILSEFLTSFDYIAQMGEINLPDLH